MTFELINSKRRPWLCILALAAVSFAVLLPILINGLPYGYDLPHHYQCAMTYVESIETGDFYPAWSLNRNFGYGGMETRLYPPISHYTLAVFYVLSSDWHAATWLTLFFFTFIGAVGVYLWAREYVRPWQAVFAGCIFALLPYHLNQIYNTFFFAEYAGTAVMPFTFVFLSRVCRRGKFADVVGLGISFAALILTHLPLTVIGACCFTIYGLFLLRRDKIFLQTTQIAAGVLLGLASSSFFWVKVVQERDLLAKFSIYTDPWLDYRLHFLATPFQTIAEGVQTEIYETATMYYDLMFLCAVVLAAAFCVPFLRTAGKDFKKMAGVISVFVIACFLITPASRFVWDRFSLLQEVQFPWRWVAVVCVAAPVIASGGIDTLGSWYKSARRPFALIITGCLIAVVTFSISQIIRPAPFVAKPEIASKMEKIATGKGFTFWWTVWSREAALEVKEKVLSENRSAEIGTWQPTEKSFRISAGESGVARIAVFYHPNWKAWANGTALETRPDENGALLVSLPANAAAIRVSFVETSAWIAGRLISAFAWLFFAICIVVFIARGILALTRSNAAPKPNRIDAGEYALRIVRSLI